MIIENKDAIQFLKEQPDCSADIIFTDPPYALGSELAIFNFCLHCNARFKKNIKQCPKCNSQSFCQMPDYEKADDFMSAWEMPTAIYWKEWFTEAKRVLKYGGKILMFGIDRQLVMFKYFALYADFRETISHAWFFTSNFPKSADLSRNIDKYFGQEGNYNIDESEFEIVKRGDKLAQGSFVRKDRATSNPIIYSGKHELAQKYNGIKYGVAALKQDHETIMVFQKEYKTGQCLRDVLAYENGDTECCCSGIDIENNRVPIDLNDKNIRANIKNNNHPTDKKSVTFGNAIGYGNQNKYPDLGSHNSKGRYPSQTIVDTETAKILDKQSGILIGSGDKNRDFENIENQSINARTITTQRHGVWQGHKDIGGCSKILHKCDYDNDDFDIFVYSPKVSDKERNEGLDWNKKETVVAKGRNKTGNELVDSLHGFSEPKANSHPTLKPIKLCEQIIKIHKMPTPQVLIDTFAGTGSLLIAAENVGFTVKGCELSEQWAKLANKRINHHREKRELGYDKTNLENTSNNLFSNI